METEWRRRGDGGADSYLDRRATAPQNEDVAGPHALLCLHAPYTELSIVNRGFLGRECRHAAVEGLKKVKRDTSSDVGGRLGPVPWRSWPST